VRLLSGTIVAISTARSAACPSAILRPSRPSTRPTKSESSSWKDLSAVVFHDFSFSRTLMSN
jgi:hypothetical protein